jgi:hypothetical protein
MAAKGHIARVRDTAIVSLKESGMAIAQRLNIDPPELDMFYRDYELLQAEELKALADFNRRVESALAALPMSENVPVTAEMVTQPQPLTRNRKAKQHG